MSNVEVNWLVVTKVRSESFGLVTEHCHYNTHPIYASVYTVAQVGTMRFLYAVRYESIRCSGIILAPWATLVSNCVSVTPSVGELSRGKKSHTSRSPSLFDMLGTEAFASE